MPFSPPRPRSSSSCSSPRARWSTGGAGTGAATSWPRWWGCGSSRPSSASSWVRAAGRRLDVGGTLSWVLGAGLPLPTAVARAAGARGLPNHVPARAPPPRRVLALPGGVGAVQRGDGVLPVPLFRTEAGQGGAQAGGCSRGWLGARAEGAEAYLGAGGGPRAGPGLCLAGLEAAASRPWRAASCLCCLPLAGWWQLLGGQLARCGAHALK